MPAATVNEGPLAVRSLRTAPHHKVLTGALTEIRTEVH